MEQVVLAVVVILVLAVLVISVVLVLIALQSSAVLMVLEFLTGPASALVVGFAVLVNLAARTNDK